MKRALVPLLGLVFGFTLSSVGFSRWDEVQRMFTFEDPRLLLLFAGTLSLSAVGFALITGSRTTARRLIHPGTVPGAMLFGIGWALTGACPSIALVQLGEGQLPALFTIAGVLFGCWVYAPLHARFFRWDAGSCDL